MMLGRWVVERSKGTNTPGDHGGLHEGQLVAGLVFDLVACGEGGYVGVAVLSLSFLHLYADHEHPSGGGVEVLLLWCCFCVVVVVLLWRCCCFDVVVVVLLWCCCC